MSLALGHRLGPYEITAKLGEGGMGEVYRATDSRLKRQVAIKVLPAAFTEDPERLARFEREAQVLAQLHHPNIASIFGLEESGGVRALVMELVDGEDLSAVIARGPLPLDEAIVPTTIPGLSVLAAGPVPPNPAELIDGLRFREILDECGEKFERVLIDSPPAVPVTDAQDVLNDWV